MTVHHILTRPALVARMEKLLAEINSYFEDSAALGFTMAEVDADGFMRKIQQGLIASLANEHRIAEAKKDSDHA